MSFIFKNLDIPGVVLIEPKLFNDSRGFFLESFRLNTFISNKIGPQFVQENLSRSNKDVLRGLHYQKDPHAQGKLVKVVCGKVIDIILDIRVGSPTFGSAIAVELDALKYNQVYIPPGLAHGFCVLSNYADFIYKCTNYYHPNSERGIHWADPDLNIQWPIENPILSPKDIVYPCLKDVPKEELPRYQG